MIENKIDYIRIEEAIRYLCSAYAISNDPIKPVLLHSIRVGTMLVNEAKSTDTCIAGFLHDTVEDCSITIDDIEKVFGENVKKIVLANTKDETIEKDKRNEDLYHRCSAAGIEACFVKAADIIENIKYFESIGNKDAVDFAKHKRDSFLSYLPEDFKDNLFNRLRVL